MKSFLVLFSLLIGFSANAGLTVSGPGVPTITMGGVTLPLSQAIVLTCRGDSAGAYYTCSRNGAAYQVPSGKKLIITAITVMSNNGTASIEQFGYSDNIVSATSPTNPVNLSGVNQSAGYLFFGASSTNNGGVPVYFEVPAGKYVFMNNVVAAAVGGYVLAYLQ
jgi:hypothetical protein